MRCDPDDGNTVLRNVSIAEANVPRPPFNAVHGLAGRGDKGETKRSAGEKVEDYLRKERNAKGRGAQQEVLISCFSRCHVRERASA